MTVEAIAKELKTTPQSLIQEGILAYLQNELNAVSVEMENIKKRWGVESLGEFEKAAQEGAIHEFSEKGDASEDLFRLSHLQQKKKHLLKLIKQYAR